MSDLLPCPFCGGGALKELNCGEWEAFCCDCSASTNADEWNTRAPQQKFIGFLSKSVEIVIYDNDGNKQTYKLDPAWDETTAEDKK